MFKNFIFLGISQLANFILPLLIMPLLISKVGSIGFGKIQFSYTFLLLLGFIVDFSHNITAPRDIAITGFKNRNIHGLVNRILTTRIFILLLVFMTLLALILFVPKFKGEYLMHLLGSTVFIGFALQTNWFYQGLEQMSFIAYANIIGKTATILLIITFINVNHDYVYVPFCFGIGNVISSLILLYIMKKRFKIKIRLIKIALILNEIRSEFPVFISNISIITYMNASTIFLGFYISDTSLGYYSIAERIMMASRQVLGVFSQVLYPRICKTILIGKKEVMHFMMKVYLPFITLVIAGCVILYFMSPTLIWIVSGKEIPESIKFLKMLSIVPLIVALNIPAYQLLMAYDIKNGYAYIMIIGAILFIISCPIFINYYEANGAVITIIMIETLLTFSLYCSLYLNKNKLKI